MPVDYKTVYKSMCDAKGMPVLSHIDAANFVAVRGQGDPNEEGGTYQQALKILYAISYALKMRPGNAEQVDGWFAYVVPPLEGFWWMEGRDGIDYAHKEEFRWISAIRLPEFFTETDFAWAAEEVSRRKSLDTSRAEFFAYEERDCVQCLHFGPYDAEPETLLRMHDFIDAIGYVSMITSDRFHHEIYLNDVRRCAPDKLRTIIRVPVCKR